MYKNYRNHRKYFLNVNFKRRIHKKTQFFHGLLKQYLKDHKTFEDI